MKGLAFPFFQGPTLKTERILCICPTEGICLRKVSFKNSDKGNPFYLGKGFVTLQMCLVPQTIAVLLAGEWGAGSQPLARMSDNKEMLTRGRQYCKLFREQCICARHQDCSAACGQAHEAVTTLVLDSH